MRASRYVVLCSTAAFWAASFCLVGESRPSPQHPYSDGVYQYRVHGKVRLLFFWIGRDDVGGGTIAVNRKPGSQMPSWTEEVEVLFGSDPERVPGKINRWGYGRELSEWSFASESGKEELKSSVFEGFMRHSKEESLAEVRANDSAAKTNSQFYYDGIRSRVAPGEAISEIRIFATDKDFDFRDSSPLHCSYSQRLQSGPPDKVRKLENRSRAYGQPFGFLTAVKAMVQSALRPPVMTEKGDSRRPAITYVYNAKTYRLSLSRLGVEEKFELPTKNPVTGKTGSQVFRRVCRLELRIQETPSGYDHDFTLWFPLEGSYQGIPLRVEDKPRWWLKLVLDLIPGGEAEARRQPAAGGNPCN